VHCSLQRARDAARAQATPDSATGSDPALGRGPGLCRDQGPGSFNDEQPGTTLVRGALLLACSRRWARAAGVCGKGGMAGAETSRGSAVAGVSGGWLETARGDGSTARVGGHGGVRGEQSLPGWAAWGGRHCQGSPRSRGSGSSH